VKRGVAILELGVGWGEALELLGCRTIAIQEHAWTE
jgi:hypothetical protein